MRLWDKNSTFYCVWQHLLSCTTNTAPQASTAQEQQFLRAKNTWVRKAQLPNIRSNFRQQIYYLGYRIT